MPLNGYGRTTEAAAWEFLDILLAGLDEPGRMPYQALLGPIARLTGSEIASWHHINELTGDIATLLWPDPERQQRGQRLMREHRAVHPLVVHYLTTGVSDVLEPEDVVPLRRWRGTPSFLIARREFGVTHQLGVPISFASGSFRAFSLGRAGRSFTRREREIALWVQRAVSRVSAHQARRSPPANPAPGAESLTAREAEVLRTLGDGKTRAAAARQLRISPRTLDKRVEHVYTKLGVTSLVAALAAVHSMVGEPKADSQAGFGKPSLTRPAQP